MHTYMFTCTMLALPNVLDSSPGKARVHSARQALVAASPSVAATISGMTGVPITTPEDGAAEGQGRPLSPATPTEFQGTQL